MQSSACPAIRAREMTRRGPPCPPPNEGGELLCGHSTEYGAPAPRLPARAETTGRRRQCLPYPDRGYAAQPRVDRRSRATLGTTDQRPPTLQGLHRGAKRHPRGLRNPFRVRQFAPRRSQGSPTFVGQPWAVLRNAFSVEIFVLVHFHCPAADPILAKWNRSSAMPSLLASVGSIGNVPTRPVCGKTVSINLS